MTPIVLYEWPGPLQVTRVIKWVTLIIYEWAGSLFEWLRSFVDQCHANELSLIIHGWFFSNNEWPVVGSTISCMGDLGPWLSEPGPWMNGLGLLVIYGYHSGSYISGLGSLYEWPRSWLLYRWTRSHNGDPDLRVWEFSTRLALSRILKT